MSPSSQHDPPAGRQRIAVLREILARRAAGEPLSDADVAAEHPELASLLPAMAIVERARVMAGIERDDPADPTDANPDIGLAECNPLPLGYVPGYAVLQEINRGGQAIVYLGRSLADDSLVAIKLLHQDARNQQVDHDRFRREAQTLRALSHPQIVAYLDSGTAADGRRFIITRYIEGEPLRVERLAEKMSLHERLALFVRICRAVGAAHAADVVHRDLKPSNIRIDRTGTPHVVDFGLATNIGPGAIRDSLTVTGRFVGTFLWASPEQKRADGKTSLASDVYSLGIILHQLATGGAFPPQVYASIERTDSGASSAAKHLRAPPRPAALRAVVERCLNFDPAERYPDANALADAVAAVWIERSRRRRWWIAAACALVAAIGAIVAWQRWERVGWTNRSPFVNGRFALDYTIGSNRFGNNQDAYIWLPPGEFVMGSPPGSTWRQPNETQHRVRITRGVYMQRCEVSQGAYADVMGVNPSRFQDDPNSHFLPVERVTYADAQEYCRRLSERLGKTVRLPTEIEWEYACRAGTTTMWSCGDNPMLLQLYANIADQSSNESEINDRMPYDDGYPTTTVVNRFTANPWMFIGMHGNVWEWCQGPYQVDPTDPATAVEGYAVIRGGSWWDGCPSARSAHRNPQPMDLKTSTLGFRVVIEE